MGFSISARMCQYQERHNSTLLLILVVAFRWSGTRAARLLSATNTSTSLMVIARLSIPASMCKCSTRVSQYSNEAVSYSGSELCVTTSGRESYPPYPRVLSLVKHSGNRSIESAPRRSEEDHALAAGNLKCRVPDCKKQLPNRTVSA